jgi:hypothetical protein
MNKPINNYSQVQQTFSFGLATVRFSRGSSEPLGQHCPDCAGT